MEATTPLVASDPSDKLRLAHRDVKSEVSKRSGYARSNANHQLGGPVIPDLNGVGFGNWVLCFLATVLPPFLTLILTSDLTPVGTKVWIGVHTVACKFRNELNSHMANQTLPVEQFCKAAADNPAPDRFLLEGYHVFLAVFFLLLFVSWLLDIAHWRYGCVKWGYRAVYVSALTITGILYAEYAPTVLVIIGLFLSVSVTILTRKLCVKESITADQFNFIISAFYCMDSLLFLVIWIYSNVINHHDTSTAHESADAQELHVLDGKSVTFFIICQGPIILSILYLILGLFIFKRGQFHVPETGDVHVLSSLDGLEHSDNIYVGQELKFVFYCFCLVGMGAWVAASVNAQSNEFSNAVARMSGAFFLLICLYLYVNIGAQRIVAAAKEHPSVQWVMDFLFSDWMKAIFISLFWPFVPLFFILEFIHQRVRRLLVCCGCVHSEKDSSDWLTAEASLRWTEMGAWNWPSILAKSINFGLIYFTMMVGGTTGTTIFLAWLAEVVESWAISSLLVVLFLVGLTMFLIPVVPGLPIYLVAGIVVVRKYGPEQFYLAVSVASVLCWAIKLTSNVVLMKCVGEPLGKNVQIRMVVGTHTPTMRAAEEILTQPGITLPKVAVLVGGPDWPTAVLCAMLKVPVCSMLVGISPVLVLIIPVVMAASYKLQPATADLAYVLMMVSSVVQAGSMVVAGIYLRAVKVSHGEEFDKPRAEDKEVYEAVEKEEQVSQERERKTRWELMPCPVRAALVIGSCCCFGMLSIYNFYSADALVSFQVTDKISSLPGGNPVNVFKNPLGFASLYLLVAQIACKIVFDCWCKVAMGRPEVSAATE